MRALCWQGPGEVAVERVPDPRIVNAQDAIVRVRLSATCGCDLRLIEGRYPAMQPGDVLGHEFVGEVVEVGPEVRRHCVGDRVVVCATISCGRCWYCRQGLYACCDNSDPNPELAEMAWGAAPAGGFGYSQTLGGFAGGHAEYVRVPYADQGAFRVPDEVSDGRAVLAAESAPAGWMAADLGGVRPGDVVAVWGCGAVGQLAARAAVLLGAERVICVDRLDDRLGLARREIGVETLHHGRADVGAELREGTGGRGPDVCVEAVGMAAQPSGSRPLGQRPRGAVEPSATVGEAIQACRKGGSVYVLGLFAGFVDTYPLGAALHKAVTVRAARQHGQRYLPALLERMRHGELRPEYLVTHRLPLAEAPRGYALFRERRDGCVRVAFTPDATTG
ncbi:zinc-dependent alcohol dehydrogenase [Plantactinospora sp. CA-290183]|uniref:zinc-dependent alcohol dehydrogenase n=1 Tax=Plantactinospora sp. CA-290183 TaxID=3240006 RepID=UPI003D928391